MSQPYSFVPQSDAVVNDAKALTKNWFIWLDGLRQRVIAAVGLVGSATKTGQSAAIATTTLYASTSAALLRIGYYMQITTADGVGSSATVTMRWRKNGITFTKAFAAVNGDTTSTSDSQIMPVGIDSGTVVDYAVAYTSTTPNKMKYLILPFVEYVN